MGGAVAAAYAAGGARVVTTVEGRSGRTRRLAERPGVELLASLDDVVREADVVLSIVPPEQAPAVVLDVAAAAERTGARPLVADLNALAPTTALELERRLAVSGLDLVDGSISGGPPRAGGSTRLYLSGSRAGEVALLPAPGFEPRVVGAVVGIASAVKMSTASVYKGRTALLAHALLSARANGVLPHVLEDLREGLGVDPDDLAPQLARAATKAHRYVGEMREIAATQEAAGLPRALFDGLAEVYAALAETPLGGAAPESVQPEASLDEVLSRLEPARVTPRG